MLPENEFARHRLARQVNYNRLSRFYDHLAGKRERDLSERCLQLLNLQPGENVLEIGPGSGHALCWLAHTAAARSAVIGLDLSNGMLKQAVKKLAKAGIVGQVGLVCGDGLKLPFSSATFDAIFMAFTLELFEESEISLVLEESARVLKAGGRIGVVSLYLPDAKNWLVRFYEQAHTWFPELVDCRPIRVAQLMEASGLSLQQVQQVRLWGLPVQIVIGSPSR